MTPLSESAFTETPAEWLWIDGEFMPLAEGTVPIEDRAVMFGDGIYEVIIAYDGNPVLLDEHLNRWERSAEGLRIRQRVDRLTRREVIRELIGRIRTPRVLIYGQLTRGAARRTQAFPIGTTANEFWFARPLAEYPEWIYSRGIAAILHPDERWARRWIKSTNLLANCLAKQAAIEAGAFEAILHREDGIVSEASTSNFFAVKDDTIYTHPTDGRILPGCTRALVLRLAREHGVRVYEEPFHLDFLSGIEEAFVSSTTLGVVPVTRIAGNPVGPERPGPLTALMMDLVGKFVGAAPLPEALPMIDELLHRETF